MSMSYLLSLRKISLFIILSTSLPGELMTDFLSIYLYLFIYLASFKQISLLLNPSISAFIFLPSPPSRERGHVTPPPRATSSGVLPRPHISQPTQQGRRRTGDSLLGGRLAGESRIRSGSKFIHRIMCGERRDAGQVRRCVRG